MGIRPMANKEKHSREGSPRVKSEFDLELTFWFAEGLRVFFRDRLVLTSKESGASAANLTSAAGWRLRVRARARVRALEPWARRATARPRW